jgi:C-terminal processing protease CtpA/Prc
VAFTRLLGYVRYFHPSDQAAATDWNAFAVRGVRAVEKANGAVELAAALDKLFRPIAPTLRVYPTGARPADLPNLAPPGEKSKVVYWRHFGVGTGNPISVYSSERVNSKDALMPLSEVRKLPGLDGFKMPEGDSPDTAKPFITDLGGGVSGRVPLALYGDAEGTFPRVKPAHEKNDLPRVEFFPTGNDRVTRLAAVSLTWNVFQHFYPYFDVVETDWPGALRKALKKAATDSDERAFRDTLRRLVAALHDGHGRVILGGLRYQETYRAPFQWDWVEERLVILHAGAGVDLNPGDVVVKIDGRPASEVITQRVELISGATPQYRRYVALLELSVGARDSELTLEVQSPAGKSRVVKLCRTVSLYDYPQKRPEKIAELKKGVLYVDIDRITADEFEAAVPKLAEATGIVFDLRGYPRQSGFAAIGHLTDKPVNSGQWHIPVVLYPDREKMQFSFSDWKLPPAKPRFKAKVAFLTDGRAISAAETFLGIIEHHHLAQIVGTATAGTNGNVNPFTVPGGYRVTWTGMKVLKQDGSRHHGIGIVPTVPVARTLRGVAEGRDEQLERALELVSVKEKK